MSLRGYSDDTAELTPRMRQVLLSAAAGHTAQQTARDLHISEATVASIRSAAYTRLRVRNITAAVAELGRRGELTPGDER